MTDAPTQEMIDKVRDISPAVLDLIILAFQAGWFTNAGGHDMAGLDKAREHDWGLFIQDPKGYLAEMRELSVDAGAAFEGDPAWDPEILNTYTGPRLVKG